MPAPHRILLALAALSLLAPAARAESLLLFPWPNHFGSIPASTYDSESRERVGEAHLVVEALANGHVRMISESGIHDGPRTVAVAELEPIEPGVSMRLLTQQSRSFDPDGTPRGVLAIDHHTRQATCAPAPHVNVPTRTVKLPREDRVVNVPLNLLFEPLARGETNEVNFQFFICGLGGRFFDFEAHVEPNGHDGNDRGHMVEVRYRPNLGPMSFVAGAVVPKLSFWFDPRAPSPWLAHRIPLYSKGPEVLVVRDGVAADSLD